MTGSAHTIRAFSAVAALAAFLAVSHPSTAHAGVFDVFGFGARIIGMGGAGTSVVDDHSAAFYNPAGLARRKVIQIGVGFDAYIHTLSIAHDDPGDQRLEARVPENPMGVSLGVVFPLGGKIDNRIALGMAVFVPLAQALRLDALEPTAPRWYRYQTLADKIHVVVSTAVEVFDWLHLGVGVQILAQLNGSVRLQVDVTNGGVSRRDVLVQMETTAMPVVGILVEPLDGWRIGASYRAEIEFAYGFPLQFDFGESLGLEVEVEGVDLYTPHTLIFGTSVDIDTIGLLVAFDSEIALWSLAPDPSLQVGVRAEGELVSGLGLDEFLDLRAGTIPAAGFRDTVTLRLGAEYNPVDWLRARLGGSWRQSATSEQSGVTSYLDSDAIALSAGLSFEMPDPIEIAERPLTVDIATQVTLHPESEAVKSDPGNPVGFTRFGGEIFGLSLALRHDF